MSDWGKLLLWMLKTMPWIVCLISAFLAFFPESLTPDVFLPIRQEWGGWFAVLFLVSLAFSAVYVVHRYRFFRHEKNRFDRLPRDMRFMLLNLYFGRTGAVEVPLKDTDIAVLRTQGYLTLCNAGMVTAERLGPSVMVTLSERSIRLFEAREKEFSQLFVEMQKDVT